MQRTSDLSAKGNDMTGTYDNASRVESLIIATVHQHRLEQRVKELEDALATARDDALEEAAELVDKFLWGRDHADAIRARKGEHP